MALPLLRHHRLQARRRRTKDRVVEKSRPILEESRRIEKAYEDAVARDDERDARPRAGAIRADI
jgi:hypothetical protein